MDEKLPYGLFKTKEQMEAYRLAKLKHEQRLKTDPELPSTNRSHKYE